MRRQHKQKKQTAVTLLELIVVIGLMSLMAAAVSAAFVAALDVERAQIRRRSQTNDLLVMQQRITQMLQGAKLSDSTTDTTTYFQSDPNDNGSGGDLGTGRITFTTTAPGVPMATQFSQDDFETQHTARGPVGGVSEVSYSTVPFGSAGDRTGLFERLQQPSDGDATQGGTEQVLSPQIQQMGFQFWDGMQWVNTWDTQTTDSHRLPAAVLVSYIIQSDPAQTVHSFTVTLPTSDVTADNPITTTSGTTTPTTGTGGGN